MVHFVVATKSLKQSNFGRSQFCQISPPENAQLTIRQRYLLFPTE